jgi:hypothetical protein
MVGTAQENARKNSQCMILLHGTAATKSTMVEAGAYLSLFLSLNFSPSLPFQPSEIMSDSDSQDASVLGKRARTEVIDNGMLEENQQKVEEEESDDDFGPMPAPAVEAAGAKKKKRKGMFIVYCGTVEASMFTTKNPPSFSGLVFCSSTS